VHRVPIGLALVVVLLATPVGQADQKLALADQAKAILKAHCHRCHGQDGQIEGGMNYVLDLDKLIARKKIVPGNAEGSPLLRRIANGTMPPPGEKVRVTDEELAILKKWIAEGAKLESPPATRKRISSSEVAEIVLADLEKFDRRSRRFQRYFTLTHLANAGLNDDELQTYRNALAKLANSLSWHSKIRLPEPLDPAKTIFRIDLRWFMWDATLWNRVLNDYPYGILDDRATARAIMIGTASKMPIVRADWFAATASRAPLYYDLLQMPGNLNDLERQLRVDSTLNIQQERVMRAAFNGSGVSRFNRILERHEGSSGGMYWRTYDFEEPTQNLTERGTLLPDRRNVFAYPLGPGAVDNSFQHAGGEVIFALPNGLHAYYVCKADNNRLDKAPNQIVSDPKRPDRQVEAGVSCMSCHVTGILPKADQIRDHFEKNPKAFSRTDGELIKALYPGKDTVLAQMEEDMKKYADAVAKTGAKVSRTEAVSTITLKYEADLDLILAAAEVGLSPDDLRQRIDTNEALVRNLGALRVAGGTVSRQVWLQTFGDLVRDLKLGTLFAGNTNGGNLPDNTGELDPLEAQGNVGNAIAFAADGQTAFIASGDRSVRIWDLVGRRDVKRLVGHTASVWSIALAGNGKRAISGSVDATARIWDLTPRQERELVKLEGHSALVSAVALNADGTRAITGGYDGAVIWWNADTGKEIRRWEGDAKSIHAVVLHPKEPLAAIAADRKIVLWNPITGEVLKSWDAHPLAVSELVFMPNGTELMSGSDDQTAKIWSRSGELLRTLTGPEGSVRQLQVHPAGRWALAASADRTLTLWDLSAKGKTLPPTATFRKHSGAVLGGIFQPSGKSTISVDRDLNTLYWDIAKFAEGAIVAPPVPRQPPIQIPHIKD
jgi:WD40 repeat protein/mono/diheme cytochrome c family protein